MARDNLKLAVAGSSIDSHIIFSLFPVFVNNIADEIYNKESCIMCYFQRKEFDKTWAVTFRTVPFSFI
jgi:hypothetical protein